MRRLTLIIYTLIAIKTLAQVPNNRQERLTKDEFRELLIHRHLFVPPDLKSDTVIIVQYSAQQLSSMVLSARKLSFLENGTDTTGLKDSTNQKWLQKLSTKNPTVLKKRFKKKGIECMIITEANLLDQERFRHKYWLKSIFLSSQKSPQDLGWVLTYTYFFHDPRNNRDYETFLPVNYSLLDLVK